MFINIVLIFVVVVIIIIIIIINIIIIIVIIIIIIIINVVWLKRIQHHTRYVYKGCLPFHAKYGMNNQKAQGVVHCLRRVP